MKKFFKHCLTGPTKEYYDIARVLWALGVLVFLALSIVAIFKNQPWNPIDFGAGLGGLLFGGGASIYIKKDTEPSEKNNNAQ